MRRNVLLISAFLAISLSGLAQTTTGSIVGTVTDTSGGILSNAGVTVTNIDTNIAVKTKTDAAGNFVVTPLLVGRYSVAVEVPGFKKGIRSGITVDVQSRVGVDFVLEVGEVTQSVLVSAPNPLMQTDSSYLGQVVDAQRVDDLPLNGRYLTRLAVLTTGTAPTTTGAKNAKSGGFSVNGVRPLLNSFLLDGMDNNALQAGLTGGVDYVIGPAPDAVAEFRVQTNSMSAEFGNAAGGVMNVTIKSGTNELHGVFYEFLRNSAVDAKNYFDSALRPIPPYRLNQFGIAGGGPLVIPRLYNGKNRTFFFADYQGTRIRQGQTYLSTVPPAAWRNGDFSGFQPIYDPATTTIVSGVATRQPFSGNQIPAARFDPAAKAMIQRADFPLPNLPGSVTRSGVSSNFLYNPTQTDDIDQFDVRLDHQLSEKNTLLIRFSFQNEDELRPPTLPIGDASIRDGRFLQNSRQAVAAYTHIFNPRLINEFRAGYTYNYLAEQIFDFAQNGRTNGAAQLGIPGIPFESTPWLNGGWPAFSVDGLTSFGSADSLPTISGSNVFQFTDILSIVRRAHTLKIGAELKPRVDFGFLQPKTPRGTFSFNGNPTRDPNNLASTGLGTANYLLGVLTSSVLSDGSDNIFQQPGFGFFVQDDYKVTKKLTLNLGLRYQFVTHATEKYDAMSSFNLSTRTLDIVKGRNDPLPAYFDFKNIPVNRNASRALVPNNDLNFAPRVGFAYHILPQTVLRGGYGIFWSFYEAGPLSSPNMGENLPFYHLATYNAVSVVQNNPIVSQLSNGFPANALSTGSAGQSLGLFSLDFQFRNPYAQHWNFSVQQGLGWDVVWDISYAGSKGTGLYEFRNANVPTPTADPTIPLDARRPLPYLTQKLSLWCACGSSTYHALQTKVEKRFSSGLSFLGAYTFSKTIDEQSEASLGTGSGQGSFRDSTRHPEWEKGLAGFDARHRFAFTYRYEVPVGRGKKLGANMARGLDALLGGWDLVGSDTFQTGLPLTITAGTGVSNSSGQNRPDVVPGVSLIPAHQDRAQWFNPAAFKTAVLGTFGNAGRNILEGPSQLNVDFSIFKNFRLAERKRLEFRTEFFNVLNHPNFQGNSIQGAFDRTGAGQLTLANASRQIQFALKLYF